ncbi:hypothetical protein [Treponema sp. R80B11-R83G3]
MEKIKNKEITITYHKVDGFTLSYLSDSGIYHHQRYLGYSIRGAKKLFKNYIQNMEVSK